MPLFRTPLVNKDQPIVDLKTGCLTPYFQQALMQISGFADMGAAASPDVSDKVDKLTSTGWVAATGTASKATFATYTAPVAAGAYSAVQMQAVMDALQVASQHLKALIDAGLASELLGA